MDQDQQQQEQINLDQGIQQCQISYQRQQDGHHRTRDFNDKNAIFVQYNKLDQPIQEQEYIPNYFQNEFGFLKQVIILEDSTNNTKKWAIIEFFKKESAQNAAKKTNHVIMNPIRIPLTVNLYRRKVVNNELNFHLKNVPHNASSLEIQRAIQDRILKEDGTKVKVESVEHKNGMNYARAQAKSQADYDAIVKVGEVRYDDNFVIKFEKFNKPFVPPIERSKALWQREYFIQQEIVTERESYTVEFKAWWWPFPQEFNFILRETINAFLNTSGGRIYFGIHNKTFRVVGIRLKNHEKDDITRLFTESFPNSNEYKDPTLFPGKIKIVFLKVFEFGIDPQKKILIPIPDLYVVKVIVQGPEIITKNGIDSYEFFFLQEAAYCRGDASNKKLCGQNLIDFIRRQANEKFQFQDKKEDQLEWLLPMTNQTQVQPSSPTIKNFDQGQQQKHSTIQMPSQFSQSQSQQQVHQQYQYSQRVQNSPVKQNQAYTIEYCIKNPQQQQSHSISSFTTKDISDENLLQPLPQLTLSNQSSQTQQSHQIKNVICKGIMGRNLQQPLPQLTLSNQSSQTQQSHQISSFVTKGIENRNLLQPLPQLPLTNQSSQTHQYNQSNMQNNQQCQINLDRTTQKSIVQQQQEKERKQKLGEYFLPKVQQIAHDASNHNKITGMLIDLEESQILEFKDDNTKLTFKIREAEKIIKMQEQKIKSEPANMK